MITLTVYPAADFNSWISLTDANDFLEYSTQHELWDALNDDDKTRNLVQAFDEINSTPGFVAPDSSIPDDLDCLLKSQSNVALQYLVNQRDFEISRVKAEKVGPMATTYSDNLIVSSNFTVGVRVCLETFGALIENETVLSSIRKVR